MILYYKMLCADAEIKSVDNLFNNINSINVDIMLEIQKDIDAYDMTSLVFLLYEVPDTALQKLIVYQRVSQDVESNNMNLLYDWALHAQSRPTWRYEFLEALCICRMYSIVRKLGFDVSSVKKHYLPENVYVNIYIDPMKKALYRICESMTSEYLTKLKRTLISYDIDLSELETCEAVFLKLMCQRLIKLGEYKKELKRNISEYDTDLLIKIFENFSGLNKFASVLNEIQSQVNNENCTDKTTSTSIDKANLNVPKRSDGKDKENFDEIFQLFNQLHMEDVPVQNLKSDTTQIRKDAYVIKNKDCLGVCCIINQEIFHPSKDSIENLDKPDLEDRLGSTKDLYCLERTMSSLKFKVVSKSNLDHKELIKFIKDVIQTNVTAEDSVFMLCILSHGVRGHVYAADSVKIKVENIQNILDSEVRLHGIPKVLILQACQVDLHPEVDNKIVPDGPHKSSYYLKKSHFLIYWATAPEYEAYRITDKGSLFIQCLCAMLDRKSKNEHLFDIFTKVTDCVTSLCLKFQRAQVPIFESTLRKKLFLHLPE